MSNPSSQQSAGANSIDMEPDSISKKARKAAGRLNCEKCPMRAKCTPIVFDVCTYVFEEGFRKGYNQRKKEEKCKKNLPSAI